MASLLAVTIGHADAPTLESASSGVVAASAEPVAELAPSLVPQRALTIDELVALLIDVGFPNEQIDNAVRIAWCESSYRPSVVNGSFYGLFQLWDGWTKEFGGIIDDLLDARTNAIITRRINAEYNSIRGYKWWSQWECT